MKFLRFLTHIFVAVFVCIALCAQHLHAYIYQAQTFERSNNERLHVLNDDHENNGYEAIQTADLLEYTHKKVSKGKAHLITEDSYAEKTSYSPTPRYANLLHTFKLPSCHGFLHYVHHAFSSVGFSVTNIEFRSIVAPLPTNITPTTTMLRHLKEYEAQIKHDQQETGIFLKKQHRTVADLQEPLRPYMHRTAWQANNQKTLEEIEQSPGSSGWLLQETCFELLERRAVIEACKKSNTTDRFLAIGGHHAEKIKAELEANGWSLISTSGISHQRNIREILSKSKDRLLVNLSAHFKALPPRGVVLKNLQKKPIRVVGAVPLFPDTICGIKHAAASTDYKTKNSLVFRPKDYSYIQRYVQLLPRNTVKIKISPQQ